MILHFLLSYIVTKLSFFIDYNSFQVGHFESIEMLVGKSAKIFVVNENGDIKRIFSSDDGKISHVCDIIEFNGYYYLGSPFNNFVGRIKKK